MLNIHDSESLEKYSSAVSLSDMEIFIFPQLMSALVLANIMSPAIWSWKDDPWFAKMDKMNTYRKIQRVKQYIMDHYDFNLDLDTWGLTDKETEKNRFADFIDDDTLRESNALFGYEGDKYYFDMDIRKHFGLEKYHDDIIPYWKTETLEAMNSFYRKEGYKKGAGECVSFSTLYYAALHIMAGIATEDIYMIATPLHSQNFVDVRDGLLTNNRRLVTKNMWFNGTALSKKAKRAIENEKITFVSNTSGYVHRIYEEASLDPKAYAHFTDRLSDYLVVDITYEILTNFLREYRVRQCCFQFETERFGRTRYIQAERVYHYEHSSPYQIGTNTQGKLLDTIEEDEFYTSPLEGRVRLRDVEAFFQDNPLHVKDIEQDPQAITDKLTAICPQAKEIIPDLIDFSKTVAKLPSMADKVFVTDPAPISLAGLEDRQAVLDYIDKKSAYSELADLALMAYRDVRGDRIYPFMKAALERNPVSRERLGGLSPQEVYQTILDYDHESIYSQDRLAQPDEVVNFSSGDGLEKAILLWSVFYPLDTEIRLEQEKDKLILLLDGQSYLFHSKKDLVLPADFSQRMKEIGLS